MCLEYSFKPGGIRFTNIKQILARSGSRNFICARRGHKLLIVTHFLLLAELGRFPPNLRKIVGTGKLHVIDVNKCKNANFDIYI